MRYIFYFLVLLPLHLFPQDHMNVHLLDNWKDASIVAGFNDMRYSDCWGYSTMGKEYAMLGSTEGVHFFEITDKNTFELIDFVQGAFSGPTVIHRDIKTYQNYAFMVCDEGSSSLQIVDLQYLPDSVHLIYENDSSFTRVHNIFLDEPNERLYACSVQPSVNGILQPLIPLQIYDISDVTNPTLLYEGPGDIPEVHDVFVRDNIAYLNCGFDGIRVYDFSYVSSPVFIQNMSIYQDQGYNHQGWLSPDGARYVFADETNGSSVKSCSVAANHELTIEGNVGTNSENGSVPHNVMITDAYAFVAYYNEGLRIYDIRSKLPKEIAFYDTYPIDEPIFKMNGAWGVYTQLPSARLLVSDRRNGLFLLDFNRTAFLSDAPSDINVYPNPVLPSAFFTIRLEEDRESSFSLEISDGTGRIVYQESIVNANFAEVRAPESAGLYTIRIEYANEDKREIAQQWKLLVY